MKKGRQLACLLLCVAIIISTVFSTSTAFANKANIYCPPNNAWLSDFYIRESSTDFIKNEMIPDISDYQKDEKSFRLEVEGIKKLINIDFSTIYSVYVDILNKAFGIVDSIVVDIEYGEMKNYLETEWKIVYSQAQKPTDAMYTTLMYACLKYDLMYPTIGIHFTVPENTTLDRAVVLAITTILDDKEVGEDIDSLEKYANLNIKRTLVQSGYLESTDKEIGDEELLLLYKIMVAENEGYMIENKNVDTYTPEEKAYVHSSYAAAVIKMHFEIAPDPIQVEKALNSNEPDAIEILILTELIKSKEGTIDGTENVPELLKKASSLGCFKLDNEFYSDIYKYDVYLIYNCNEIWMTPFTYAAELGNDHLEYVTITINGEKAENSRSSRVKIENGTSDIIVELKYDDGETKDTAKYLFRIHNGNIKLPNIPAPTPTPAKVDSSYNGPNLIAPERTTTEFHSKEQNSIPIEPFKLSADNSNPFTVNSQKDMTESLMVSNEINNTDDEKRVENNIKKVVLPIISAVLVAVLIAVTAFLIIKRKRKMQNKE